MAKKKKSQLKPVARGFATTSVPKKVVENEQNTDDTITDNTAEEAPTSDASHPSTVAHVQSDTPQDHSFDPDKVEEQSLQNLVDKYQEKTEKETLRTIKVNDTLCHSRYEIVLISPSLSRLLRLTGGSLRHCLHCKLIPS